MAYKTAVSAKPSPSASEHGAAALEFALILPLLVMFLFGIAYFGQGYEATNIMSHAAREAVRPLALRIPNADPNLVARANSVPPLKGANLAVAPSGPQALCTVGNAVTVTLTYSLPYSIPLYGSGTWSLTRSASMRCGG